MADARAEQILAAIKTACTGLTTTGANIQRGQVYPHDESALPALGVFMGADQVISELQTGLVDWELTVLIQSAVKATAEYTTLDSLVDQQLNQIRKEVHAAVMASPRLGLTFVIDTAADIAEAPRLESEGAYPYGFQTIGFTVTYRSSRSDISA